MNIAQIVINCLCSLLLFSVTSRYEFPHAIKQHTTTKKKKERKNPESTKLYIYLRKILYCLLDIFLLFFFHYTQKKTTPAPQLQLKMRKLKERLLENITPDFSEKKGSTENKNKIKKNNKKFMLEFMLALLLLYSVCWWVCV